MGEHRRKADGRRVFSTDFKRSTVQRILTGEKTLAEVSRELRGYGRSPCSRHRQSSVWHGATRRARAPNTLRISFFIAITSFPLFHHCF
jgi:hypothetical protein